MAISRRSIVVSLAALAALPPQLAFAGSHAGLTVEMLNRHPDDRKLRNLFLPRLLVVEPGQSVLFKSADRGHNSASVKGMIPDGATAWKGRLGKDIAVTFDIPGFYGDVCTPHTSMGMVGMVVVTGDGMMDNYDSARAVRQRGKAAKVFDEIWAEAAAQGLTG